MRKTFFHTFDHNQHFKKIEEHFGGIANREADLPDATSFVFLCFTNRCGSNYLAELIASGGEYNLGGEDLNWDTVVGQSKRLQLASFQDYFAFLTRHVQKSDRAFIKIATAQIDLLGRAGILDQIIGRSKFILIERSDKLGQAISFALAFATGRFTSYMKGTKSPDEVEYTRKQVDQIIGGLVDQYRQFDLFFARNGITPLSIVYEQLTAEPEAHLATIARHLGLPAIRLQPEKLRLERQSSGVNAEWRRRYLTEDS